tara:strand:- start:15225 stop:15872 length:648 start_codon:yes stop_codon:yes gene_type:complete
MVTISRTNYVTGPFCGAQLRSEGHTHKTCRNPAGKKTAHPGQGRCYLHGGNSVKTHGRYSQIDHEGFQEKLGKLEAIEQDVMDLVPEVQLLRTLVIDYVERYEKFAEALIAWHADGAGKTSKPRKVMDITDAGNLIEKISRTVQRIHAIHSTGSITLDTFKRVVESMGITVAKHITDKAVLDAIEAEWSNLALDARDPGVNPAPGSEDQDGQETE